MSEEKDPVVLQEAADVTEEVIALAIEAAEAAYGLGNDFTIRWETAYDILEREGYCLEEWDSPADRKIRRTVLKHRAEEGSD